MPTPEQAVAWLRRWDDQQSTFFTDREERFSVIADVVELAVDRPDPLIVDLGVGPGSLTTRLLRRLPQARVVGVDMDPLLLGLAQQAYGPEFGDRLRLVQADLRTHGWLGRLELDRAPDAFVSTTALHWLEREPLADLLTQAAGALAPGGVFVDGDHLYERTERFDDLLRGVARHAQDRAGRVTAEDWEDWWRAAEEAPELAGLWAQREATDLSHAVDRPSSVHDYLAALRAGGLDQVGQVWQVGDDRVIVGLRAH